MTMIRRPDRSMSDAIERFLRDPFAGGFRNWEGGLTVPPVDVRETPDTYLIEVEIPGLRPENIDVEIDGNTVTIRGHDQEETNRQEESYLMRERRTRSFVRSITLPGEIDTERTTSSYEDGELRIELPKSARARARRIEVRSSARSVGESSGTMTGQTAGDGPQSGATQGTGTDQQSSRTAAPATAEYQESGNSGAAGVTS
jgi:HSP20 family protein